MLFIRGTAILLVITPFRYATAIQRGPKAAAIRIGAVFPFKGAMSSLARQEYLGVEIARDMVNKAGRIEGHQIVLHQRDLEDPGSMARLAGMVAGHAAFLHRGLRGAHLQRYGNETGGHGLWPPRVLNIVAALVFGSEVWVERGELFSVLCNTWGRLGYFRFGAPGTRGFLGGLKARFEPTVSRITFVLLLLVSVSFDGLLATPAWKHAREQLPSSIAPGTAPYLLLTTLAFIGLLILAWLLFGGFALAVKKAGSLDGSVVDVLSGLVPSLLPIALGYLVAHNAEYLVINGQLLLPLLGNPPGVTWWPRFPYPFNDSYEININLLPSGVVWYTQVGLIVLVHVAAVILAHDYLARVARTVERARRAEWPWIIDMVCYTMSSLWLLAQPLIKGG